MVRLPFLVRYFWPYTFFMEGRHSAGDEGGKRGVRQRLDALYELKKKKKKSPHRKLSVLFTIADWVSMKLFFLFVYHISLTSHFCVTQIQLITSHRSQWQQLTSALHSAQFNRGQGVIFSGWRLMLWAPLRQVRPWTMKPRERGETWEEEKDTPVAMKTTAQASKLY